MGLPNTLLLTYQIEFETTEITIDELCEKYEVDKKDLKHHDTWKKQSTEQTEESATNLVPTEQSPDITPSTIVPNTGSKSSLIIPESKEAALEDIETFKFKAIAHANKFMDKDAEYAEIKEFKDMVAIVDNIEKSYKDVKDSGPTVNILIQNLTNKFSDEDV